MKRKTNYYICEDCGELKSTKKKKILNIDSGKLLCQKCSTKYTNKRFSKRNKNSQTIKARYANNELEHMRKAAQNVLSERNKSWLRDLNKNRPYVEKKIIARKKRETWLKRPKIERKKINFLRTSAFRRYNNERHNEKLNWFNSLNEEGRALIKNYNLKYKFYDENWDSIRKDVLKKANYKCECCGRSASLDIHHGIPFIFRQEHVGLYALCRSCHMKIERRFDKFYNKTNNLKIAVFESLKMIEGDSSKIDKLLEGFYK